MKPIELTPFQGHIVLYCKGQYHVPDGKKGFFEGLKMIWAIRCGYDYEYTSRDTLTYIANDMYDIISKCEPHRLPHLMDKLHREVNSNLGKPENLTPIEAIIWEYRGILSNMQVREEVKDTKKFKWIIKLPKPKYRIFNRILRGNGRYEDYELISN